MQFDFSVAWARVQTLIDGLLVRVPDILVGLLVFTLFALLAGSIRALVLRAVVRGGRRRNLGLVLGRLARFGVMLLGLLLALAIVLPTFSPGDVVQLLGIGSVAIGFAFRDILQNFLAGILLLLTEPFRIGDQIIVGDYEGTVEDIQTRATFITTYDGRRVVIPNAALFTGSVIVNTAFDTIRLQCDIGIGYGDDIDRAKRLMLEAMAGVPEVLREPAPEVLVVALADSSVLLRARWWTRPPRKADTLHVQDRVIGAIKATLLAHGIDLPFPTHQVLFHDQTEETDGDRARQREGWPDGGDAPRPRGIAAALDRRARPHPRAERPGRHGEGDGR
jgi:small conductance mechanosensitive channel